MTLCHLRLDSRMQTVELVLRFCFLEVAEPALMAVVNNFISERNSSEVMAVG